jgi:hypothetical protein
MPEFNVKDYLSNDALTLHDVPSVKHPKGTSYTIPAPSADEELRMRRIVQIREQQAAAEEAAKADDADEATKEKVADVIVESMQETAALLLGADGETFTFQEKMLGTAYAKMVEDGVKPSHIDRLASLVMTNYGMGEPMAGMIVEHAQGEALARANRATRRAVAKASPRKRRASKPKAGLKSSPASTASDTPASPTATSSSARSTSARKAPAAKTA